MGKFIFKGTVIVEGGGVRRKTDAINALQVMIDDFDDMNDGDISISIHWDGITNAEKKV